MNIAHSHITKIGKVTDAEIRRMGPYNDRPLTIEVGVIGMGGDLVPLYIDPLAAKDLSAKLLERLKARGSSE